VWRGRQHDERTGALGEARRGRSAVGPASKSMRLIQYDDIPDKRVERSHDIWPLHEIDRRNSHGMNRPGIRTGRHPAGRSRETACVQNLGRQRESRAQFLTPLLAQAGRGYDQGSRVRRTRQCLCDDQTCLNRFPEADFVRYQNPAGISTRDRQGGFKLKRDDVEVRPCRRSK
jgi:hypothetical protein